MVSAVAVPRVLKSVGTITNSEEAGVTQESVRSVPPTTPSERLSFRGASEVPPGVAVGATASGGRSVSVMDGSDRLCAVLGGGSGIASAASVWSWLVRSRVAMEPRAY